MFHDTTEMCCDLKTQPVQVTDLKPGDYLLLADDIDHNDAAPILVPAADDDAVLWRFAGFGAEDQTGLTIVCDAPDEDPLAVFAGYDVHVRLVLPGQDHERWEPQL